MLEERRDQARGGAPQRPPDDDQNVRASCGGDGARPNGGGQRFSEPNDVGPKAAAATVLDRSQVELALDRTALVTSGAARFAQIAVQFEYVARTGAQVQ